MSVGLSSDFETQRYSRKRKNPTSPQQKNVVKPPFRVSPPLSCHAKISIEEWHWRQAGAESQSRIAADALLAERAQSLPTSCNIRCRRHNVGKDCTFAERGRHNVGKDCVFAERGRHNVGKDCTFHSRGSTMLARIVSFPTDESTMLANIVLSAVSGSAKFARIVLFPVGNDTILANIAPSTAEMGHSRKEPGLRQISEHSSRILHSNNSARCP